jgi:hypothetical protein
MGGSLLGAVEQGKKVVERLGEKRKTGTPKQLASGYLFIEN